MTPAVAVADQIDRVAERLSDEYADRVPAPVLRGLVDQVYGQLANARVTQFVPVLVDRAVRTTLRQQLAAA